MDAISPYSLANKLKPSDIIGPGLRHLADLPDTPVGKRLAGAAAVGFSTALDHLVAPNATRDGSSERQASEVGIGTPKDAFQIVGFALERAVQLHEFFASAPPALPARPASQAPENLPGMNRVRAAYDVITRLH